MAITTKTAQSGPTELNLTEQISALSERLDRVEQALTGILTGKVAEISQEEKDRQTLSRRPNSYPEAVEYKAAQERQAERDGKTRKSDKDD
jgi:hypothetical protein